MNLELLAIVWLEIHIRASGWMESTEVGGKEEKRLRIESKEMKRIQERTRGNIGEYGILKT